MKPIFLIGMPGSGKSHWGQIWGANAGFAVIDTDRRVELKSGKSIPEIFNKQGEAAFRALEAEVLREAISESFSKNTIIVTGGGTPIFGDNMQRMLTAGCVVYLRARTAQLMENIGMSKVTRPLLYNCNEAVLIEMLQQRREFYERAHLILETESLRTDTFVQILEKCTGLL